MTKHPRVDLFILVYFGSGFQFMATWFCHFWVRVWWGRVSQKCWTVPQGKAVHFRIARKQKTNKQTKASKSSTREPLEPFYIWTIRLAFQLKCRYLLAVLYLPIWIWSIKWVFVSFLWGGGGVVVVVVCFMVLWIKPRALYMIGNYSVTELQFPAIKYI